MKLAENKGRWIAIAASVITMVVILFPVRHNWTENPRDGFPLSYYPMFTAKRGAKTVLHHAVGVTKDGQRINIPGGYAGAGGMNAVRRQMRAMYRNGRAEQLAERVAERLQGSRFAKEHSIVSVEVVKSEYAIQSYFEGRHDPQERQVAATVNLTQGASL